MNNKKKIAIVFPKDSEAIFNKNSKRTFGGATIQMYLIAREVGNYENIKTFSLIPNYKTISFEEKNKFHFIKTFNEKDNILLKIKKFHQKIKKIKPDIIIQHGLMELSCLMALYCKIKRIKFVFMFAHDIEVEGKGQSTEKNIRFFKLLLKYSHKLISQNEFQQNFLMKKYSCKSNILYNGFDIPEKRCVLPDKKILWVARSDKWKQPEKFIDLSNKNPLLKFVMICPQAHDYNYFDSIREKAEQINNLEFIDFVPFKEINSYFEKSFLFINTSEHEGFPQTFIQATMNSVPILSLNVNPGNFITKYNCGFVCRDFEKLNDKLKYLTEHMNIYKKLSQNAYKYANNNHDIQKNVKALLTIIS